MLKNMLRVRTHPDNEIQIFLSFAIRALHTGMSGKARGKDSPHRWIQKLKNGGVGDATGTTGVATAHSYLPFPHHWQTDMAATVRDFI